MLTLTRDEAAFLAMCLGNFLVAFGYLLWGCFLCVPRQKRLKGEAPDAFYDGRGTYAIRFLVMLLCPVAGPCFFLMGWIAYRVFFHQEADLASVIFRKERGRQFLRADEEKERVIAPLEETLLLGDRRRERLLMMNVVQRDLESSLSTIALALNSVDSETTHYAASALQEVFSDFRILTGKLSAEMERETGDESEYGEMLIDYMRGILRQNVFSGIEQKRYVEILEAAGETVFQKNPGFFTGERYEDLILCLLKEGEYEKAAAWCQRLTQQFPGDLCSYKCRLRLSYTVGDSERFFQTLEELKRQNMVYDREIIEVFRAFE